VNPLRLFGRTKEYANLFSLGAHNRMVQFANAILKLEVKLGERPSFLVSDHNAVLTIPRTTPNTGNGFAHRCEVTAVADTTLTCEIVGGTSDGQSIIVTRPPELDGSLETASLEVRPAYEVGSVIYAAETVAGYIDLNVDARTWYRLFIYKDYGNDCAEMQTWIAMTEPVAV